MKVIDKSRFTPDELATYTALIAKGMVEDDEIEKAGPDEEIPESPPKKKDQPAPEIPEENEEEENEIPENFKKKGNENPLMKSVTERLAAIEKQVEMENYRQIAKSYAVLGENETELADNLYNLAKSDKASYDAFIAVLDKSKDLVEKSGVFAEIGKSDRGMTGGSTVDKVEAAANEIMKSDATMTREQAVAKAWIDHPELIAEYDAQYRA